MAKRKPYPERTDLEKIESQWRKLSGLHTREEWSAALVRATTAAELAATLAIRKELEVSKSLPSPVVDSFLVWANGLDGKVNRLILPLLADRPRKRKAVNDLFAALKTAIKKRNMIVHGGHFCGKAEATKGIAACKAFTEGVVAIYYDNFELVDADAA